MKKCEQTMKDAEYYHAEAESMRSRYNEIVIEKQRLEQEVNSLRMFVDEERKEMADLRRQQQEVLSAEGGESLSLMYSQLLQNYENVKDDFSMLRKRYDDLVASHSAAVSKLEHTQVRGSNMLNDGCWVLALVDMGGATVRRDDCPMVRRGYCPEGPLSGGATVQRGDCPEG